MNKLSPFERLDLVLNEIHRYSNPDIELMHLVNAITNGNENSFYVDGIKGVISAVNKLDKDELVECRKSIQNDNIEYKYYKTTFKGELFIQDGGYIGKAKVLEHEKNQLEILQLSQIETQSKLVMLTCIIAIGTFIAALYYLLEIWKYFNLSH